MKIAHVVTAGSPRTGREGDSPFLGREHAQAALDLALLDSHLITVEAPAGGGKSRLLREWSRRQSARVLWAKADRQAAPSPFQMFSRPMAQLEAELAKRPDLVSLLVHELGVELPILENLQGRRQQSPGLQRGTLVMLGLALAVFGKDSPSVLVLDDCQWADPLTLRFLEYWSANGEALLVVATFRGDEVPDDHLLRQLPATPLRLPPLSAQDSERLLLWQQPDASAELREQTLRFAGGNPFLIQSYLRSGHVEGESETSTFTRLSGTSRQALAIASVLGREFDLDLLTGCLPQPLADLREAIDQGLVHEVRGGYRFAHDRIRDIAMDTLHPDELIEVHAKAARYLHSSEREEPYLVAFHFHAAGCSQEGFPHALRAAKLALDQHDLNTAVFYFLAALTGCEEHGSAERGAILAEVGDCYRLIGQYAESLDFLLQASRVTTDLQVKARLQKRIGDVHFKQGDLELARSAVQEGLRLLGQRLPKVLPLSFLKEALVQSVHSLFPSRYLDTEPLMDRQKELLCAGLYNRLAYVNWFLEGPIPAIWAHLRELNMAERYPATRTLARARVTHAVALSTVPAWSRALAFGSSGVATARAIGDLWSEGQALHFYGAVLLGASRLEQAREKLEASMKKLCQTGDRWEENGARYHLALTYYRLGALEEASKLAQETQLIGVELCDRLAAADNLFTWARASGGRISPSALLAEQEYSTPDIQRAAELWGAEGVVDLRYRGCARAATLFQRGIALYRSCRAQSLYSACLPCWLVTARRLHIQDAVGAERTGRLRLAQRCLKPALQLARKYRNNLPHALREQGLLLALENRKQQAQSALQESLAVATAIGMAQEIALAERALSQLDTRTGSNSGVDDELDWLL